MKTASYAALLRLLLSLLAGGIKAEAEADAAYTVDTSIAQAAGDPVFGDYGRLLFPVDSGYASGRTLGELRLVWCGRNAGQLSACAGAVEEGI